MSDRILEAVAEECHNQWSRWTRHLVSKLVPRETPGGRVFMAMPAEWIERWGLQVDTPYAKLTEAEKESDRREARKIVSAIEETRLRVIVPTLDAVREALDSADRDSPDGCDGVNCSRPDHVLARAYRSLRVEFNEARRSCTHYASEIDRDVKSREDALRRIIQEKDVRITTLVGALEKYKEEVGQHCAAEHNRATAAEKERDEARTELVAARTSHEVTSQYLTEAQGTLKAMTKDRDAWKNDSQIWSGAWEREIDGYYWPKTHRIDAAVVSTRKIIERLRAVEGELKAYKAKETEAENKHAYCANGHVCPKGRRAN